MPNPLVLNQRQMGRGIFGNIWKHFWLSQFGGVGIATVIKLIEAGDAAKYPTMHRTVPTTKSDSTKNVTSAKIEKPSS